MVTWTAYVFTAGFAEPRLARAILRHLGGDWKVAFCGKEQEQLTSELKS